MSKIMFKVSGCIYHWAKEIDKKNLGQKVIRKQQSDYYMSTTSATAHGPKTLSRLLHDPLGSGKTFLSSCFWGCAVHRCQ